jgi:hypothetical protein
MAARDQGQESMLAGDITEHLGEAFLELETGYNNLEFLRNNP